MMMYCNVFAATEVKIVDDIRVNIMHTDSKNGKLEKLSEFCIPAGGNFDAGFLMASVSIPHNAKEYVSADVHSSARNIGEIRVVFQNFGGF